MTRGTLLVVLALAGCEAQPLGSFQTARYLASPTQPDLLASFAPGGATLAPGEVARLDAYVRGALLGPDDDVVVYMGPSGSRRLDAERLGTLRKVFPATRARVRVVAAPEAAGVEVGPDGMVVRTVSYGRITVECPGNTAGPLELTTPLPEMTCSNAFNRATMAANPRDLIAPDSFGGTSAGVAAAAVQQQRDGKVPYLPLGLSAVMGE